MTAVPGNLEGRGTTELNLCPKFHSVLMRNCVYLLLRYQWVPARYRKGPLSQRSRVRVRVRVSLPLTPTI